jgi:hypothetical protein
MSQLIKVTQDGPTFVMTVELESGHKERWTYRREEHSGLVSYTMIDREDA